MDEKLLEMEKGRNYKSYGSEQLASADSYLVCHWLIAESQGWAMVTATRRCSKQTPLIPRLFCCFSFPGKGRGRPQTLASAGERPSAVLEPAAAVSLLRSPASAPIILPIDGKRPLRHCDCDCDCDCVAVAALRALPCCTCIAALVRCLVQKILQNVNCINFVCI